MKMSHQTSPHYHPQLSAQNTPYSDYDAWFNSRLISQPYSCHAGTTQPKSISRYMSDNRQRGFTLIELLVTIVVLTIIISIAAPSILSQLASMEARRVKNQLKDALALAKAESYIRRQNVLVCLSNASGQCDRDSDNTLLLFIDTNDNNNFDDQVDTLLSRQPLHLKYSRLSLRVGAKRHYIKFWGDSGTPRGFFGHIKYCPTSPYNHSIYQISFNQTGGITYKPNVSHPTRCDK